MGSVAVLIALQIDDTESEKLTFMECITAIAAVEAVKMLGWNRMKLYLKWQNDIYKQGLQLGVLFREGALWSCVFEIVVGVGLSATNESSKTCLVPDGGIDPRNAYL